jgi:hypothetical protein
VFLIIDGKQVGSSIDVVLIIRLDQLRADIVSGQSDLPDYEIDRRDFGRPIKSAAIDV